jgi:transcription initiation factor TFIIF subunit beta
MGDIYSFIDTDNMQKTNRNQAKRPQQQKATRMPRNELLDRIFLAFKEYKFIGMKYFKTTLVQPESYLREVLESIAVLVRSGTFNGTYTLKPENAVDINYGGGGAEMAPEEGIGFDGQSSAPEDEEGDDSDVKMEDALP